LAARRFERGDANGVSETRDRLAGRDGQKLSVGIVGLGYWGPNLLRVLYEQPGVEVRYICDLDGDRLARFGARYPTVRATADFDNLLADDGLDAILIATPVYTHYELASKSLAAGKHTFVEKPLAPSTAEADALLTQANEAGLVLMCGHTFIYSPAVRAVKAMIDRGDLGDIHFISSSRVNLGLHQRDVSVIWDLAPHDFSILLYWLGQMPEWMTAVGRDAVVPGITDIAFMSMRYPSGALAHVELSWLAPSKLRRTVIVGSEKMVVYDDTSPEPVRVFDSGVTYKDPETFGEYHLSYRTGDIVSPRLDNTEPIAIEIADFLNAINGGGEGESSGELARNVVAMIEAAEASLGHRGAPVEPGAQHALSIG
jgi:predicted dehydrogenase